MLDKLNEAINKLLGRFQVQPEYEEVGENLIREDFSTRGILSQDNLHEHIHIPSADISTAAGDEEDKLAAHNKFVNSQSTYTTEAANTFPDIHPEPILQEQPELPATTPTLEIPKTTNTGNILRGVAFVLAALALLIFAYVVYIYTDKILTATAPVTSGQFVFDNSLVRADNTRTMSVEPGVDRTVLKNNILQTMNSEDVKIDKVTIVVPSYLREQTQNNKKVYVSEILRADDFLFVFLPSAPLALRTVASGDYALGLTNATGKTESFLSFSVNDKVAATRELLRYEPFLPKDLKDTFKLRDFTGEATWKDLTVNNHDLHILSDNDGVILVYGFATTRAVLFAPNVDIFEKVSQRLK